MVTKPQHLIYAPGFPGKHFQLFLWCGFQLHTQPWLLNAIILNATASNCVAHKHGICISTHRKDLKVIPASARIFKDKNLQLFCALKAQKTEMFHFLRRRPKVAGYTISPQHLSQKTVWLEWKNRKRKVSVSLPVFWLLCQLCEKAPQSLSFDRLLGFFFDFC